MLRIGDAEGPDASADIAAEDKGSSEADRDVAVGSWASASDRAANAEAGDACGGIADTHMGVDNDSMDRVVGHTEYFARVDRYHREWQEGPRKAPVGAVGSWCWCCARASALDLNFWPCHRSS